MQEYSDGKYICDGKYISKIFTTLSGSLEVQIMAWQIWSVDELNKLILDVMNLFHRTSESERAAELFLLMCLSVKFCV